MSNKSVVFEIQKKFYSSQNLKSSFLAFLTDLNEEERKTLANILYTVGELDD